jgi:hypothetical protein
MAKDLVRMSYTAASTEEHLLATTHIIVAQKLVLNVVIVGVIQLRGLSQSQLGHVVPPIEEHKEDEFDEYLLSKKKL